MFSRNVSVCISEIANWMRSNRLQLNTDKTEVLWCSTGWRLHQLPSACSTINRRCSSGPGVICSQSRHLYRLRSSDTYARSTNGIAVFCRTSSTAPDPSLAASVHVSVARGRPGSFPTGLKHPCLPNKPSSAGVEGGGTARL
jgi:hypothetical protein